MSFSVVSALVMADNQKCAKTNCHLRRPETPYSLLGLMIFLSQ